MEQFDFGLILPCYNFASGLESTLEKIEKWKNSKNLKLFLCLVNDGSQDDTGKIARRFLEGRATWFTVRDLPRNEGKGFAIREGVKVVPDTVPFLLFTDCDLFYGLDIIADRILPELKNGADVVILDRSWDRQFHANSRIRKFLSYCFNHLKTILTAVPYEDSQAGLKGFRAPFLRGLLPKARVRGFAFDVEVLSIAIDYRFRVDRIPIRIDQTEKRGPSSVTARKAIRMFYDLLRIAWARFTNRYACNEFEQRISDQVYEIHS